ncbi:MAG: hypothetical protein K2G76_01395, partial [Prevotella sp.]|nr:hypothetical protein [Prevotella sp.]
IYYCLIAANIGKCLMGRWDDGTMGRFQKTNELLLKKRPIKTQKFGAQRQKSYLCTRQSATIQSAQPAKAVGTTRA